METAPSVRNDTVLPSREYVASYEAQVVINVLLVILGIWSTFGNTLTILAITTNRETKTRANFIICSLAVSDLLSGIIVCPLWIYKRTWGYEEWLWGDSLCKLYAFAMRSALYCTTWHITAFSILRYIAIRWPFSPAKIPKRKLKYLIIGMWMMALAFGGALHCLFFQVEPVSIRKEGFIRWPSCSVKTTDNGVEKHLLYYTVSTTCFILLPMGVLFVSSILITKELLGRTVDKTMNRIVKEHRAIAQLGLISTSYLIGYLPTICYVMWSSRTDDKDDKLDYWVLTAAYFCLRISECLNPIIYNVTSSRMRKASKRVLHLIRNCGRPNMELESGMHMNSVDSARKM